MIEKASPAHRANGRGASEADQLGQQVVAKIIERADDLKNAQAAARRVERPFDMARQRLNEIARIVMPRQHAADTDDRGPAEGLAQ